MLDVLWNKYTRDTFELLDKSESTLQVPDLIYLFYSCMVPFIDEVFGSGSVWINIDFGWLDPDLNPDPEG
jgi:hypothetical protein